MHPCAKFEFSSFTHFGDMFQGVQNCIRVTWSRPHPVSTYFASFGEIVHLNLYTKFEICSFTRFGDIFNGRAKLCKGHVTWRRPFYFLSRQISNIKWDTFGWANKYGVLCKHIGLCPKILKTRWAGQSPALGRPSPQVRVESHFACAQSRLGQSLARVYISGRSTP